MKTKTALLFLLLPLTLTSCGGEAYDVNKPSIGNVVNEASIVLANGEKVTVKNKMSVDEYSRLFSNLQNLEIYHNNWDGTLDLKLTRDDKTIEYSSKGKTRFTDKDNKRGFYTRYESKNFVSVEASTSPEAQPYNTFQYTTYNNKYVSFAGTIPNSQVIKQVNDSSNKEILFEDPDYEPGMYSKDDLPMMPPNGQQEYSDYYTACNMFSSHLLKSYPCYSMHYLLTPTFAEEQAKVNYVITDKYLIVDVDRPYGFFSTSPILGADIEVLKAQSESLGCYVKSEILFNLDDGTVAYVESSFKTIDFSPSYRLIPFEGKLKLKVQKDGDEGYNKFNETRNKIMKEYTTKN